jgi:hypothetical protein
MNRLGSLRGRHLGECGWFWVWAVAGGCAAMSFVSFIGVFFLPVAALSVLAALRWGRRSAGRSALGAITGAGVPFLIVAYVQRKGPGTVCWHTATASGCDEYLDPRPWLAIGLMLTLGGVAAFLVARAGQRRHLPGNPGASERARR